VQLACQRYSHILILELSTCPHSPTAKDKLEDVLLSERSERYL
jgi:hypothetical protein